MANIYTGTSNSTQGIESRYNSKAQAREVYLDRARDCSELTIPTLIPRDSSTSSEEFATTYQGIGARGVNNLASKLLLSLLPPNAPFFRLAIDNFAVREIEEDENLKTQIDSGLVQIEKAVMDDIEMSNDRVVVFEALKHLIVAGNALLFVDKEGLRVFPLSQYVIERDPMGNVLEIITKESIHYNALPDYVREQILKQQGDNKEDAICDLYTCVKRETDHFMVHQEVKGIQIKESYGKYKLDQSPYIPLRMVRISAENYGRSYVEEYQGDLVSLEGLTKAIVEGSSASAKTLFMVAPNGTTRAKALAESENGAIIEGSANDVSVLQVGKFADFRVAQQSMVNIEQRLSYAFLLNASVIRDSERTTAEEVRMTAQELQDSLGGIYGVLSQEFQLPLVRRKLALLSKTKKLPQLPKGIVFPKVITGIEALGRTTDRNKLIQFLQTLAGTLGAESIAKFVNVTEAIKRLATADGIETKGLIRSEEDLQAEQQAQQQSMMDEQQQSAMLRAGEKIAGNIPPKTLGETIVNQS
jgi:hypothetical protein|tara:strand:- start:360 stop:1946 length:1587 start_codon:yes stop_codon:yes gene_type:complete